MEKRIIQFKKEFPKFNTNPPNDCIKINGDS